MSGLSTDDLKHYISNYLNQDITIPDDHQGALVTFVNKDKIEVALATKVIDNDKVNWNVELIGSHEWIGNNTFGIMSKMTW